MTTPLTLAELVELADQAHAAADAQRAATVAELAEILGRDVRLNAHGAATITVAELELIRERVPSIPPASTSPWSELAGIRLWLVEDEPTVDDTDRELEQQRQLEAQLELEAEL